MSKSLERTKQTHLFEARLGVIKASHHISGARTEILIVRHLICLCEAHSWESEDLQNKVRLRL